MEKNAIDYLLEFAQDKNCIPWIKDVIYTFIDFDGKVSDDDKERLVKELLEETTANIVFKDKKAQPITNRRIDFLSLQHISGVNALAANQTIRFGKDINIIYGLNGTGKSSYFRIINEIIGENSKSSIIGNIYMENPEIPRAKLTYEINGIKADYVWDNSKGGSSNLSSVRVFDTSYTVGLLKKRSSDELLAKPFRLSVFSELISFIEDLLKLANEKISEEENGLPVLNTDSFSEKTKTLFAKEYLSVEEEKQINDLGCFDIESANRIIEVQDEIKGLQQVNIGDKIKLEAEHKDKAIFLVRNIEELYKVLKEFGEKTVTAIALLKQRKEESDAARLRFENLNSIPGIESEAWKRFVSAGKEYSDENAIIVCPYCRRPYDETALGLVTSYSEFLADEHEVNYKKQVSVVKALRNQVDHIRILTESEYYLEFLSEESQNRISDFFQNANVEKTSILKAIDNFEEFTSNLYAIDLLLQELNEYISNMEKQLKSLNSDADEKAKKIKILTVELATLLEKKSIANQRSAITQLLAGKKKVIREKKAIAEINTKKLSNLSRKAHDELLTKNLETLFGEILRDLNIKDISIQLKSQNNKGVQQTELMIKGIKSVDDILSEGEQKATALALFLAEIILSDNHSVLVFDDPVNSMDHRMMGSFAEKLLQIDNQVILFTHNRMFLESFGESSNGHFCKTYDTACNKNKGRHILLYETLSEGKNSKGVISRKQIDKAKDYIRGVEELLKESPFTKKQEACAKLRFAVELLIDEIVFNGQVPTKYSTKSSRINWEGLKSITSDSAVIDILKDVHGRCSGGELHNGMERNENPVEKADIQEMVNKLKEISH